MSEQVCQQIAIPVLKMARMETLEAPEIIRPATPPPARPLVDGYQFIRFIQKLGTLALLLALGLASYFLVRSFLVENVEVVGVSMMPTLQEHNHYVLNRWSLKHREPRRAEVVVLRDPQDKGFSVKRIIATAGESVLLKNGKVFVNGRQLDEPYLAPDIHTYTYNQAKEQLITCGKDQYFVLGDNRPQSIDSRAYGPVPRENILGLVMLQ